MQKWEYCLIAMNHAKKRSLLVEYIPDGVQRHKLKPDKSLGDKDYADVAYRTIGSLGLEGWEMVDTSLTSRKGEKVIMRFMFKRVIKET
jgi:hypothetical protein